jgi:hypothetical protein
MIERFEVENHDVFGRLVEKWAENRRSRPKSLEEFIDQLAAANAGATIPARIKKIKFAQPDLETLILRLPPKGMIPESREKLKAGNAYPLPLFYQEIFGASSSNIPEKDRSRALESRIGDYTIAQCL